jgi:hypothetical protein
MATESKTGNTAPPRPFAPPLPTAEQVPPELLSLKRWLGWRYELNNDRNEWTKIPAATHTGRPVGVSLDWQSYWTDFATAIAGAAKLKLDGVGFVFVEGDGFTGTDLDKCRDAKTGAFRAAAKTWLDNLPTYAEVSPSGTGAHAIARSQLPAVGNKHPLPEDVLVKVEMYDHSRYFTFTGQRLENHPLEIASIQPEINALHHHVFGAARLELSAEPGEAGVAREFLTDERIVNRITDSKKWADIFNPGKKAQEFTAQHYHGDDSSADMAFCTIIARFTANPGQLERLWRRSILWREKSATRADYRLSTINRAMAESQKGESRLVNTTDVADVSWLWTNRFPRGKLVIIDGDPGQAKSMLSLAVAVSVMTGKPLLDGAKPEVTGGVVLLSAEDDLRDTINPRLVAAGAPQAQIPLLHVPSTKADGGQFSLGDPDDRFKLERMIARIDAKLVIVDPLNAYLGEKVDSHNDQKIRQVLGPLSEIANKTGAVVLCLRHLAKSGGTKAIYRGMGSIGYTAAARANFFVADHPEKKDRFVIAASKFNLGPKPPSLEYFIETVTVQGLVKPVPRVAGGAPCALTANDLSAAQTEEAAGGGRFHEAADFLREALKDGVTAEKDVKRQARDLDIAPATLKRAKKSLKIRSTQKGRAWYWQLAPPEDGETTPRTDLPF